MGTDKAFLCLGSLTLLEHAIATVKEVCEKVALVGDKDRLRPYGGVIEDQFAGQGPLSGIQAALNSDSTAKLNLVLAVDTPAISPELLKYLFKVAEESTAVVTVPRSNGHPQTLCAIYRPEFGDVAERSLRAGRNKIEPLFSEVEVRVVEEHELKGMGFSPDIFDNVNTPEDWQQMQQRFGANEK